MPKASTMSACNLTCKICLPNVCQLLRSTISPSSVSYTQKKHQCKIGFMYTTIFIPIQLTPSVAFSYTKDRSGHFFITSLSARGTILRVGTPSHPHTRYFSPTMRDVYSTTYHYTFKSGHMYLVPVFVCFAIDRRADFFLSLH